jgi:hypothetical protein
VLGNEFAESLELAHRDHAIGFGGAGTMRLRNDPSCGQSSSKMARSSRYGAIQSPPVWPSCASHLSSACPPCRAKLPIRAGWLDLRAGPPDLSSTAGCVPLAFENQTRSQASQAFRARTRGHGIVFQAFQAQVRRPRRSISAHERPAQVLESSTPPSSASRQRHAFTSLPPSTCSICISPTAQCSTLAGNDIDKC